MSAPRIAGLYVRLLGELALMHDGFPLPLPASRKTRAIFAYLLLCAKPVRRERLCELFFDIPDDPRAALRWSLSKIRGMLGSYAGALHADRARVELKNETIHTDVELLRQALETGNDHSGLLAEAAMEPPLPDLDLSNLDTYAAWLAAERAEIDRLRALYLSRMAQQPALTAELRQRYTLEAEQLGAPRGPPKIPEPPPALEAIRLDQTVHYCLAADGVRIAYACTGDGPPLVKTANWLNHLELDWSGPVWGRLITELSVRHRLVRYDERGNGLSEWDVADLSFEAFVRDLETVVDTLGLDRFPLLGISQGVAVSIEYAARHPGRVTHLILLGGYAAGWRHIADAEEAARREAVITLVAHGWGEDTPIYRQIFSQTFMPSATHEEIDWFNDFQRATASAPNAARFLQAFSTIDVRHRLAEVKAPTLVLHARGDQRVPIAHGIEIASRIPGASLVTLDTDNHVPLSREPATTRIIESIEAFLRASPEAHPLKLPHRSR
jgi:pimeloyl-ACP methyl ester carboxylesterase